MPERAVLKLIADDAGATGLAGALMARTLPPTGQAPDVVTLAGDLGAGKTTLVRAFLRELGLIGTVRSPTYTLIEPYETSGRSIYHLDLYRLAGPSDLEALGLRDLLRGGTLLLVEWPERAGELLARPDLACTLSYAGTGRAIDIESCSPAGHAWLAALARAVTTGRSQSLRPA